MANISEKLEVFSVEFRRHMINFIFFGIYYQEIIILQTKKSKKMKNLKILSVIICAMILFSACSGNKEEVKNENKPVAGVFSSDLEATGWMNQFTLCKDVAHSGRYSSRVDSVNQFSFGFREFASIIGDTIPKKVDIDFWMLCLQTGIKSTLVLSIDSVDKNIFWHGIELADSVKTPNKWQEIKTTVDLPENIMATDKISIYVWNKEKRTFYIDDLKVTFGKGK